MVIDISSVPFAAQKGEIWKIYACGIIQGFVICIVRGLEGILVQVLHLDNILLNSKQYFSSLTAA